MSVFASHLRQLRKDRGAKKEDIATYLGITPSYYNKFEAGARTPSLEVLIKLKTYFNCSLDDLVATEEESTLVDRQLVVSYRDLYDMGFNERLAHGLIKEVYDSYQAETIPKASLDKKVKFVYKKDVVALCDKLKEQLEEK